MADRIGTCRELTQQPLDDKLVRPGVCRRFTPGRASSRVCRVSSRGNTGQACRWEH